MSEFHNTGTTQIPDNLQQRAVEAARLYLARQGYDMLDGTRHEEWPIVAEDERGVLVFVKVRAKMGVMPAEKRPSRKRAEAVAAEYVTDHLRIGEQTVRFDTVSLNVFPDGRALVRHHIGCLS